MTKKDVLHYLQTHALEFKELYSVEKLGLLGSYARDEVDVNSDVDLFATMKPDLFAMVAVKEKIEEELHVKVDLIRKHKHIKPIFLEMIQKDLVYAS